MINHSQGCLGDYMVKPYIKVCDPKKVLYGIESVTKKLGFLMLCFGNKYLQTVSSVWNQHIFGDPFSAMLVVKWDIKHITLDT